MNYDYEISANKELVCGIDEVGRGPFAGDVYAAAVILPINFEILGINDSKKLSEKKRELISKIILENAVSVGVGIASVEEIDEINITNATYLAMCRAVENMSIKPDFCYIDGSFAPPKLKIPNSTLVKGDAKCISIAAASIVAKVTRDRYMKEQSAIYPKYGFERNKGYGTSEHISALKKYGSTPIHRSLFIRKYI